ncbi:hypothetical protein [[Clostridium] hylemonae]|uniref:hypothetical protein n=1 Tax=[Clostridium] hylemonae TaxID=89153 RepID=UPI001D09741E|nr:hypothetical protein [[Clostridium] hylemonae]MCB7521559.1 hypothetical protein [[Clostridium] hylemonae]BDF05055.1 hypothetical protein CE91St63_21170 [[Clostridium] hylemonae]
MSEQYNINVQPVLNTDALYEQLNNQKYKINVEVDGAALNSQLQSAVNSVTGGAAPAKVPVEFDVSGLKDSLIFFNTFMTSSNNLQGIFTSLYQNLD